MKYLKHIFLVIFLFLLDVISKDFYRVNYFRTSFFDLHFVKNTGVAFGLFSGLNILFLVLSVIVISIVIYYYTRRSDLSLCFDFILAGALGNAVNRVMYGHVIDFIDFRFWPVFNFADVFIVMGVVLLIFKLWKE